jgi:DNA-binding NarL/FixJ family response regulator
VAHSDSLAQSLLPASPSGTPREAQQDESANGHASAPIRIVLALAAELDRMAWSIVINNQTDMELAAATSSSRQLVRLLKLHAPQVVLLDEPLVDLCPPGALLACARKTACRFVLIAMHQPDYSLGPPSLDPSSLEPSRLPRIHARLLKGVSAPDLLRTLRAVASGHASSPAGPDAPALDSSSSPFLDSLP